MYHVTPIISKTVYNLHSRTLHPTHMCNKTSKLGQVCINISTIDICTTLFRYLFGAKRRKVSKFYRFWARKFVKGIKGNRWMWWKGWNRDWKYFKLSHNETEVINFRRIMTPNLDFWLKLSWIQLQLDSQGSFTTSCLWSCRRLARLEYSADRWESVV